MAGINKKYIHDRVRDILFCDNGKVYYSYCMVIGEEEYFSPITISIFELRKLFIDEIKNKYKNHSMDDGNIIEYFDNNYGIQFKTEINNTNGEDEECLVLYISPDNTDQNYKEVCKILLLDDNNTKKIIRKYNEYSSKTHYINEARYLPIYLEDNILGILSNMSIDKIKEVKLSSSPFKDIKKIKQI